MDNDGDDVMFCLQVCCNIINTSSIVTMFAIVGGTNVELEMNAKLSTAPGGCIAQQHRTVSREQWKWNQR